MANPRKRPRQQEEDFFCLEATPDGSWHALSGKNQLCDGLQKQGTSTDWQSEAIKRHQVHLDQQCESQACHSHRVQLLPEHQPHAARDKLTAEVQIHARDFHRPQSSDHTIRHGLVCSSYGQDSSDSASDGEGEGDSGSHCAGEASDSVDIAIAHKSDFSAKVSPPEWANWVEILGVSDGGMSGNGCSTARPYFHNTITGQTCWEIPPVLRARRKQVTSRQENGIQIEPTYATPFVTAPRTVLISGLPLQAIAGAGSGGSQIRARLSDLSLSEERIKQAHQYCCRQRQLQRMRENIMGGSKIEDKASALDTGSDIHRIGLAEVLLNFLHGCGEVTAAELYEHGDSANGVAVLVEFLTEAACENALALDGRRLFGWQARQGAVQSPTQQAAIDNVALGLVSSNIDSDDPGPGGACRKHVLRLIREHNELVRVRRPWRRHRHFLQGVGRVFVSGFPEDATDVALVEYFNRACGHVDSVWRVASCPDASRSGSCTQRGLTRGKTERCALIKFGNPESSLADVELAARRALALHGTRLHTKSCAEQDEKFAQLAGSQIAVALSCHRRCGRSGDADMDTTLGVHPSSQRRSERSDAVAERILLGAVNTHSHCCSVKQQDVPSADAELDNTLYVGNLPFSATEQSLKAALVEAVSASAGPRNCARLPSLTEAGIADVRLVYDKSTHRFRGFAFVQCCTPGAQRQLLAMDGTRKFGRALRVRRAHYDKS